MTERPPLGLKPRFIHEEQRMTDIKVAQAHDEQRMIEIKEAVKRYAEAALPINAAWIDEYNEIADKYPK